MSLSDKDISVIKGMLKRGDRQSDIAAWFGGDVNSGRVSEINTGSSALGARAANITPANADSLPPPGPYQISGRASLKTRETLEALRDLITETLIEIDGYAATENQRDAA